MKKVSSRAEVTLTLRPSKPLPPHQAGQAPLSHVELLKRHGASEEAEEHIRNFAREHHLKVVVLDPGCRIARLAGSNAHLESAFPARGSRTPAVPASLTKYVNTILGLGPKHHVRRKGLFRDLRKPAGRTLAQLARAYRFPESGAAGQTIGLLEFGGGFRLKDIEQFCRANNVPVPKITVIRIEGARNNPSPTSALNELLDAMSGRTGSSSIDLESPRIEAAMCTMEVTMDVEMLAALAPGARLVVYFAPSDRQFLALHRAIYDRRNKPSVLSISWGQRETAVGANALKSIHSLLETAAHLGITVCASTGDQGAQDGSPDGALTVNFPASSPFCLACGGTSTHFAKRGDHLRILRETVWNSVHFNVHGATGGGVSRAFPTPPWQKDARVPLSPTGRPGRGVPDVAGPADPRSGCDLLINGQTFTSAGTSAVAPLWAALIARCNAVLGCRCGHINQPLYGFAAQGKRCLRPVLKGSNGGYHAGPGWNPCTGYGTPLGSSLLRALQDLYDTR